MAFPYVLWTSVSNDSCVFRCTCVVTIFSSIIRELVAKNFHSQNFQVPLPPASPALSLSQGDPSAHVDVQHTFRQENRDFHPRKERYSSARPVQPLRREHTS
jgi:hypothetical protein